MLGLDNPSNGLELMNNSTSLPPPLRFLHPDCKTYKAKHGDEVRVELKSKDCFFKAKQTLCHSVKLWSEHCECIKFIEVFLT